METNLVSEATAEEIPPPPILPSDRRPLLLFLPCLAGEVSLLIGSRTCSLCTCCTRVGNHISSNLTEFSRSGHGGRHDCGGTTRQMPNGSAFVRMLAIYASGSLNSYTRVPLEHVNQQFIKSSKSTKCCSNQSDAAPNVPMKQHMML